MIITRRLLKCSLSGALILALTSACSGNKSSDDDAATVSPDSGTDTDTDTTDDSTDDDDSSQDDQSSSVANALAQAFPGTLALSVFPQTAAASLTGSPNHIRLSLAEAFDPNALTIKEKIAEQEKIAAGTADSCLPDSLGKNFTKESDETCYEFDQDMIYGTGDTGQAQPRWLGTKNGQASNGEACLVAFTRNQVSQVVAMVDQTLGFGMAAICQHKKDHADVALPAIGESIDLSPALSGLFGDKISVSSALLERLADADDHPVYRMLIKATMGADDIQRTIGIIHSPHDEENSEYSGTLYTVMEGVPTFGGQQNQNQQQDPKYQILSIVYQRSVVDGAKKITADLRSAQVAEALAPEAITSAGLLDFNVGTNVSTGVIGSQGYGDYTGYQQANEAVDGITFIAFDLDTETNEGTLAYWKNPGGNYYENARGFNVSISKNEDSGDLEGCATSGAASTDFSQGISIRRYLNPLEADNDLTLTPKGFWHPFMNSPSSSGTDADGDFHVRNQQSGQVTKWYVPDIGDSNLANTFTAQPDGSLITRQCFALNASSGLYEIDTDEITTAAGFEVIDTGNSVNSAKFIPLPGGVKPPADNVVDQQP